MFSTYIGGGGYVWVRWSVYIYFLPLLLAVEIEIEFVTSNLVTVYSHIVMYLYILYTRVSILWRLTVKQEMFKKWRKLEKRGRYEMRVHIYVQFAF